MKEQVIEKLLALNRVFYSQQADSFAASRAAPQPGFQRLLPHLPPEASSLLDIGCGEGRFGRFAMMHSNVTNYVGIDFTPDLLIKAAASVPGDFYQRDFSRPDCLAGLERFDIIVCLAALQHLPGRQNRVRLLTEMGMHLRAGGRLILSNWQFMDSPRQRRKVQPWAAVGLDKGALESGDYLLTWKRDGFGLRYVCLIGAEETSQMAGKAGLTILDQFRSDGREGDLNLYSILGLNC